MGGPAFGLRSNDSEGEGMGRCVAVLAGGPSGGHQAAVLGAVSKRSTSRRQPSFLIQTIGIPSCLSLVGFMWGECTKWFWRESVLNISQDG